MSSEDTHAQFPIWRHYRQDDCLRPLKPLQTPVEE